MFQVEWLAAALDELAAIWIAADPTARPTITAASHEAEQRLRRQPLQEGESREGATRVMFVRPLMITFEVLPDDMRVRILHVQSYQPGS